MPEKEINLLNDGTAKYLKKVDFTNTWSVAHWMRFHMFSRVAITHNINSILDVGFGENVLTEYLEDAGYKGTYLGIDLNEDYVNKANNPETAVKTSYPAKYEFKDVKDVEGVFDCIVLGELVEHLEKKEVESFLKSLWDKLSMGGIIMISTPNKIDGKINWPDDHYDEFELEELLTTCINAGYLVEDTFGLWNNTENTKATLDEYELRDYEKSVNYMPKALVNVLYNMRNPRVSRQILTIIIKK